MMIETKEMTNEER